METLPQVMWQRKGLLLPQAWARAAELTNWRHPVAGVENNMASAPKGGSEKVNRSRISLFGQRSTFTGQKEMRTGSCKPAGRRLV